MEGSTHVWKWCLIEWQKIDSDESEKDLTEEDLPNSQENREKREATWGREVQRRKERKKEGARRLEQIARINLRSSRAIQERPREREAGLNQSPGEEFQSEELNWPAQKELGRVDLIQQQGSKTKNITDVD